MSSSVQSRKQSLDQHLLREAGIARTALLASLGANALLSIIIIVQALLLSQSINRVFQKGEDLRAVSPLLLALLVVISLRGLMSYFGSQASAHLAIRVKNSLRKRLMTHLYALGPGHIHSERSGDLVLTATEGIEKLDGYYRDYVPGLFTALFLPLLILVVVLPVDLLTFVVMLITAPLIPFFMALIGMAAGALAKRQFFEMRYLGAHFIDVMQGFTTLKVFNRSQYQIETISRITGQFREATMRVLRVAFLSAFTLEMLATLSVAIVAVEIGVRLINTGISFEQALFLLVIAPEFYLPLRALGAKFHNATEGKAAAERLFDVLDDSQQIEGSEKSIAVPQKMLIRFEDVTLTYDSATAPTLRNVSFEIKPNQWVVIVGVSGSGKTTITNLLLRFLQPDAGRIVIDGMNLSSISIEQWREQIAWVSQSPYLFNATIAENICFSRPEAPEVQMVAAAQAAGAHEFILQLPMGYQTLCGERGLRLSGGQAQRIALARAYLRQSPLLILDEPTSSLDPESEADIIGSLNQMTQGRTVLIVTHRLSLSVGADHIIVMDNGTVAEQGTHNELMAIGGAYAHLVDTFGDVAGEA